MKNPKAGEGRPDFPFLPGETEERCAFCKKFMFNMKRGAALAFEIGKLLYKEWGQLDVCESWPQWCREHLPFGVSTANRYLRICENFKDDPGALEGQTMTGALKLLSASETGGRR